MELKTENYISLSSIIVLLLGLMIIITNLIFFIRRSNNIVDIDENINLAQTVHNDNIIKRNENYKFNLLVDSDSKVIDAFEKSKIPHSLVNSLKDIEGENANLVIDSNKLRGSQDARVIRKVLKNKKAIIFLNMPDDKYIEKYDLKEILGIASIKKEKLQKQLNILSGFMLGGLHELKDLSYKSANVKLLASTKTYAYGKDDLPVIWRNTYTGGEVYLVNGPFMEMNVSYGFITALMSEIFEDYIYPVINTRLMLYEGLPYISYCKEEKFMDIYSRTPMQVQNDIILPDILTFNKRRGFIPNGYLKVGFENKQLNEINELSKKQVNIYESQIYKEKGDVGLSYTGDLDYDIKSYKEVFPNKEIRSILVRSDTENIEDIELERLEDLTSVLGPWKGFEVFGFIDKDTVYIPVTCSSELEFISAVTAFGASVNNLSLEDVVALKGDEDNWRKLSKNYTRNVDDYRQKYKFLENRNITSTARATKIYNNSSPEIKRTNDNIQLSFDHWYGKSYYILKTNKEIKDIENGKIQKIEDGAYLITVLDKNVIIKLREAEYESMRNS